MCGDWISLDDEVRRIMEGLEVENSCRSLPAVTPTAAFREGISALSDGAVCYPGSLWSAFTAACPHPWRSRQDTRPSVATGLPDDSNGALREADLNGVATDTGGTASVAALAVEGRADIGREGRANVYELEKWRDRSPAKFMGGEQTVTIMEVTRQSLPLAPARRANR